MTKPLEGIKVLDLTRALAGPFCALMLGDYGADVIKIERPGVGDDTRKWGPPFIGEESAYFLNVNRNKRSLTLNLRDEKAQQVFLQLAADADIIVENFTPDVMPNFNLAYEDVKKGQPGHYLLLHLRLRGHRPLPQPPRLRPDHAGHQRPDEHYRRPRRRPAEGRHRRFRHRRRHVGRLRRHGRPAPPQYRRQRCRASTSTSPCWTPRSPG